MSGGIVLADTDEETKNSKETIAARIASEVAPVQPGDVRDLLPSYQRQKLLAEAERIERELEAELALNRKSSQ